MIEHHITNLTTWPKPILDLLESSKIIDQVKFAREAGNRFKVFIDGNSYLVHDEIRALDRFHEEPWIFERISAYDGHIILCFLKVDIWNSH